MVLQMRESVLLSQIAADAADGFQGRPDILVGPGDDCAVVETHDGGTLLLTVDQLIEGVHYRADRPTRDIAAAAVGRSISDIAAMGGSPRFALATAALNSAFDEQRAAELFRAMAESAQRWGCPLVGGDIAATKGPTVLTVTVIGVPHPIRGPVLRLGSRPGDLVCITGPVGGALASNWTRLPEPRLDVAHQLCVALGADLHAMIDVSDGLGRDAARLAERSGVAIELDSGAIPLAPGVASWRDAIAAGEDYELCFTCPTAPPESLGCRVIGRVVAGAGCRVRTPDGQSLDVSDSGWDHQA
jgi:thiamine-monophosphate kinase